MCHSVSFPFELYEKEMRENAAMFRYRWLKLRRGRKRIAITAAAGNDPAIIQRYIHIA